jgi:D-3-phosphoglycerate dehydrogenase / 2-oxoglutarate reductase
MTPVIYSTHALHDDAMAVINGAATLKVASALDAETLAREGSECDAVIVRAPLPEAMFGPATKLKCAVRHGAGVDMIPIDACTRAGVLVANVPGANAPTVAEHVLMVSMMLLRRHRQMDDDLRGKGWLAGRAHALIGHDLRGRAMGMVGMGAVGRAIAAAGQGFGLKFAGFSPSGGGFPPGVAALGLDAVIAQSDILVLCCPLKPETRGLIDARRLALMRRGGLLINVARGPVAVETDVLAALRTGQLAGAALDVFDRQPLLPDHPYLAMPNVIITPHMAGITDESMARMGVGAAREALLVIAGGLPVSFINPEAFPAYRARFP